MMIILQPHTITLIQSNEALRGMQVHANTIATAFVDRHDGAQTQHTLASAEARRALDEMRDVVDRQDRLKRAARRFNRAKSGNNPFRSGRSRTCAQNNAASVICLHLYGCFSVFAFVARTLASRTLGCCATINCYATPLQERLH
jgi:hypothetical protein